jgi:polyhydroxyalkanoate synthesis regulator phasin
MTPAVSFSSATMATRPGAGVGQLAALSKRQQALSEKLVEAGKSTPPPPSTTVADAIAREISGVQAQIEQIILEAQLSKLTTSVAPAANGEGPAPVKDTQTDPVPKMAKPTKDTRTASGSPHTGAATTNGQMAVTPRLSAAAAAQYGAGAAPVNRVDESV